MREKPRQVERLVLFEPTSTQKRPNWTKGSPAIALRRRRPRCHRMLRFGSEATLETQKANPLPHKPASFRKTGWRYHTKKLQPAPVLPVGRRHKCRPSREL